MLKRIPRLDILFAASVTVITGVVFGVLVWHLIANNVNSDYQGHIFFAQALLEGTIYRIHALYQVVMLGINVLPGIELPRAAWAAVLLFYAAAAIITYGLLRQATQNRVLAAAGTLVASIAAPITILTWFDNLHYGYVEMNTLHNPTMVVIKPFALLLFAFALRVLEGRIRFSWRIVALGAGLIALSIFAKPNFAITLLPALIVVVAYRALVQRNPTGARLAIIGLILPSILLLAVQYVLQYSLTTVAGGGVGLLPFATVWFTEPSFWWMAIKLVASIAFPLTVYLLYRQPASSDLGLGLGWWLFVSGMAQMYLGVEYGITWNHNNFWWSAETGALILFVATLMFWFRQWKREPRLWIALVVLALHIVSGFALYYSTMTLSNIAVGW